MSNTKVILQTSHESMQIQVKRYRMLLDDEEEEELTLLDHAERHNASFLDLVEIEFRK